MRALAVAGLITAAVFAGATLALFSQLFGIWEE